MNVHVLIQAVYGERNMYPCSSTLFSLSVVENEQADAGKGGRARLARLNSQARMGTWENSCFPVQPTTSRIGNHTRLIHALLKALTIHTYIHNMYIPRRTTVFLQYVLHTYTGASTRTLRYVYSICVVPAYLKFTYHTRCTSTAVLLLLYRGAFGP